MKRSKRFSSALVACGLMASSAMLASVSDLGNFIDDVSAVLPNRLSIGLKSEISYEDNIYSTPSSGNKTGSAIIKNSVYADLHRQVEGLGSYGLRGEVGYDYYDHDAGDKNEATWSLYPYLNGGISSKDRALKWRISLNSTAKRERMSSADTRYARHYTNGITLGVDYQYHPRWGIMSVLTGTSDYYSQSEFESYSNEKIDFSLAPYYVLTEKMRIGIRVGVQNTFYRNSDTNDDSTRWRFNGFWDWRANQQLSMTVEAGVERTSYRGSTKDENDSNTTNPDGSVTIRYLPYRNLGFIYRASLGGKDSTLSSGLVQSLQQTLTANWEVTSKIMFSQTFGLANDDDKSDKGSTREWFSRSNVNYKFTEKISCYAGYEHTDVTYTKVSGLDYNDNIVKFGINVKF